MLPYYPKIHIYHHKKSGQYFIGRGTKVLFEIPKLIGQLFCKSK